MEFISNRFVFHWLATFAGFLNARFLTENAQMWVYSNLASNRCFAACQPDGQDKVGILKCNWFCQNRTLCWVLALGKLSGGGFRTCLEEEAENARTVANQPNTDCRHYWRVESWCPNLQFLWSHHVWFESYVIYKIRPVLMIWGGSAHGYETT